MRSNRKIRPSNYCTVLAPHRIQKTTHNFPMKTKMTWENGNKIAKILIVVAAVYFGMKFLFPIVLPFLIAFVLARFLYPLAKRLEQKTVLKKSGARCAAYVLFLAGVGAAAAGALYLCYRMGSSCLENMDSFLESADRIFCSCCEQLEEISGYSMEEIMQTLSRQAEGFAGSAVSYSKDAGWYMVGLLAKIFVSFIAAFLMLQDYEGILRSLNKTQTGKKAMHMLHDLKEAFGAYLRAQLMIMGVVTAVCVAGLLLLGVGHAVWIGIAIGFCDALPFIGTGTVFVPWALVELLLGRYRNAAGYLVIYFVCSFIRQLLEPKLVGKKLGVPPLAVLMSIYVGIGVYGGGGVILGPASALLIFGVCKEWV